MKYFAASGVTQLDDTARGGTSRWRPDVHGMLGDLFRVAEAAPPRASGRRLLSVVAQVAAVVVGAVLPLERIPGLPSWDTIYGEDYWEFGTQAPARVSAENVTGPGRPYLQRQRILSQEWLLW